MGIFRYVLSCAFITLCLACLNGQTASVFIDVGGSIPIPSSSLCTPSTQGLIGAEDVNERLDCVTSTGFHFGGPYTFQDPIPPGNKISQVEVILYNASGTSTIDVDISSAMIQGIMSPNLQSQKLDCPTDNVRGSELFDPMVDFGYMYGGMNDFELLTGTGIENVCFSHAEIVFTIVPEHQIPTMGQWTLFILGLILTSLAVVKILSMQSFLL